MKESRKEKSWFYRSFLNNHATVLLINILIVFLIIFLFSKISFVFQPVGQILGITMPPVILALILYYLINPLINVLEKKFHVNRILSISVVFIIIAALIVWGIMSLIPLVQSQITSLIKNWPSYWDSLNKGLQHLFSDPKMHVFRDRLMSADQNISKSFEKSMDSIVPQTFNNIGSALSVVTNVVMILLTAPFILFFMLKDDKKFKESVIKFVPNRARQSTSEMLTEMSQSLSSYITGQLTVAFWVAVMFFVGYLIIGQRYALVLGIVAGILNLIPYIGSTLALLPSLVIAAFIAPSMVLKVIIVFLVEQTIETRVISPIIVGNKMQMHPVTTILVLLVSAGMYGLIGMIAGIPIFAILKIICTRIFRWFKRNSSWYTDEDIIEEESQAPKNPQPEPISDVTKDSEKNHK
ncbi:AI-2E family transporter [Companilactobacillus sp.]|jgi:predicted PurR-regulated permease PerM|uniref:AI-2E family transporter n=1 Tax=Companilactobacillus sp. TaxID=2767905 RepID=UPI0025BD4955|nr:AI-2E family transporter [Companilactobacillus sp.]MCH4008820.1 AI-2E family transporter [Companilactobacillus sp.]MCH4051001.1 AI-2E family transporter [Companilactobacillus sp.]MCH4076763.1 AI-2E family transporter [Companilactobacillus sp.]MCH4125338.1 AI-2E family transporter [Companilactobacillus sp.]MCH4131878.1 AI-2E family transporter [Companilactobacillus sp.]